MIFNDHLPSDMPFINGLLKKKGVQALVQYCYLRFGLEKTVVMLDRLKELGFLYATKAGISIGISDMVIPSVKFKLVDAAEHEVVKVQQQYLDGAITNGERYNKVIAIWSDVTEKVADEMFKALEEQDKQGVDQPDLRHGRFRRARIEAADSPAFRNARIDGQALGRSHRDAHHLEFPRRPDGVAVLHLHARRPQGSGRYGA